MIIHQTWKTKDIPYNIFPKEWVDSWIKNHPGCDYRLWSDEDNRDLIKSHYPKFLGLYDSYDSGIKRADIVRYFILHKFGGLYIDLDCVSTQNFSEFLEDKDLAIGIEPEINSSTLYNNRAILSNALMYSKPGHPFWVYVFRQAIKHQKINNSPVFETGPILLTDAYDEYVKNGGKAFLLDRNAFLWNDKPFSTGNIATMKFKDNRICDEKTFVIHVNVAVWSR